MQRTMQRQELYAKDTNETVHPRVTHIWPDLLLIHHATMSTAVVEEE